MKSADLLIFFSLSRYFYLLNDLKLVECFSPFSFLSSNMAARPSCGASVEEKSSLIRFPLPRVFDPLLFSSREHCCVTFSSQFNRLGLFLTASFFTLCRFFFKLLTRNSSLNLVLSGCFYADSVAQHFGNSGKNTKKKKKRENGN